MSVHVYLCALRFKKSDFIDLCVLWHKENSTDLRDERILSEPAELGTRQPSYELVWLDDRVTADGQEVLKGGPRPPVATEFTHLQPRVAQAVYGTLQPIKRSLTRSVQDDVGGISCWLGLYAHSNTQRH